MTAPREELLDEALDRLAVSLRHHLGNEDLEILGPARAVLARINRRCKGETTRPISRTPGRVEPKRCQSDDLLRTGAEDRQHAT